MQSVLMIVILFRILSGFLNFMYFIPLSDRTALSAPTPQSFHRYLCQKTVRCRLTSLQFAILESLFRFLSQEFGLMMPAYVARWALHMQMCKPIITIFQCMCMILISAVSRMRKNVFAVMKTPVRQTGPSTCFAAAECV